MKHYAYELFGQVLESGGTLDNPFMFTGQYYDSEIDQYYLRGRQYDPLLARFTARDPVLGQFEEPLTLHTYLYCINDPVNKIDPTGRLFGTLISPSMRMKWAGHVLGIKIVLTHFIQTLQTRALEMEWALHRGGVWLMAQAHQGYAAIAHYGWKALAQVGRILTEWQMADPGGPLDFALVFGGDPHPPVTPSGMAAQAITGKTGTLAEIWEGLEIRHLQVYGKEWDLYEQDDEEE